MNNLFFNVQRVVWVDHRCRISFRGVATFGGRWTWAISLPALQCFFISCSFYFFLWIAIMLLWCQNGGRDRKKGYWYFFLIIITFHILDFLLTFLFLLFSYASLSQFKPYSIKLITFVMWWQWISIKLALLNWTLKLVTLRLGLFLTYISI